jgi:S1-C subfamily serine protease
VERQRTRVGGLFRTPKRRPRSFLTLSFGLVLCLTAIVPAQKNDQNLYAEYAKKASEQSQYDPLIGIWSGSMCGKRIILAVIRADEKGTSLQAFVTNGKDVGYGFKNGDVWFLVSPLVTSGVYEGKTVYRSRFFKNWYPNRVVMTSEDIFTAYDDVTGRTCGSTTNTYVRREPRPKQKNETRSGSGFLLYQTALVLTCNHLIEGASQISVRFASGTSYEARVAARDANNDIAVLRLTGFMPEQDGFRISLETSVAAGDAIHVIGYPLGNELSRQPSIVSGQVSSTSGIEDSPTDFRMTTPINPGNSGGPVLNEHGDVVGIAASAIRGHSVEGIAFGIKVVTAISLLQQVGVKFDSTESKSLSASQLFSQYSKNVVMIETK